MPKMRIPEATVYVDGQPTAILRAPELPAGLVTRPIPRKFGPPAERYLVSEYLAAIKVDLKKVRALHVYGGSRVVAISGDEVRAHAGRLAFDFTMRDRGKVNMSFPPGIKVNTTVDLVTNFAVYVDKEPPSLIVGDSGAYLAFADGKKIEGIPYAEREQLKGTRVYVDGALVSTMKRRTLPASIVLDGKAGDQNAVYSLSGFLSTTNTSASVNNVKAVDLLSDDDLVVRFDAAEWMRVQKSMTFTLPQRSRGQLTIEIPGAGGRKARISAVQIFSRVEPPKRWLAPTDVVALADDAKKTTEAGGSHN
jgi:hypothetical protein